MEKVRWSARVIALQALTGYTEEVWKDVAIDGIDLAGDGRIDDWGARLFALAVLRCDLPEDEVEQVATLETIINVARREDDGNCRAETTPSGGLNGRTSPRFSPSWMSSLSRRAPRARAPAWRAARAAEAPAGGSVATAPFSSGWRAPHAPAVFFFVARTTSPSRGERCRARGRSASGGKTACKKEPLTKRKLLSFLKNIIFLFCSLS